MPGDDCVNGRHPRQVGVKATLTMTSAAARIQPMPRKTWPLISILLIFLCLGAFIVINDVNYRRESIYRDIQIDTFAVYSDWNIYIGTLRGLLLTTRGFGRTLDEAAERKRLTEEKIAVLKRDAQMVGPGIRETLKAFIQSIEEGLRIGQELQDTGYLFLQQPDLPGVYREGRVGLYSLIGKDATAFMGELSAYQYYQLVGRLKGMNVLFDQLFSDRLDAFLHNIAEQSEGMRRNFFLFRVFFLSLIFSAIIVTLVRLAAMNRRLKRLADTTNCELISARSHLTEVQDYLHSAQFQNSLFDMVAGISHELNTPLGNCMTVSSHLEGRAAELLALMEEGNLTRETFLAGLMENREGFALIQASLIQMRAQIDTFKRLSGVNHEMGGALVSLSEYIHGELPRLAAETAPNIRVTMNITGDGSVSVPYMYLNQIFVQLIANSREHGRASAVHIRFDVDSRYLFIHCSDNGIGVADDMLDRMSEPFFTTARGSGHMGLGLSIVASLVSNKLRGTISYTHEHPGLAVNIGLDLDLKQ